eukprot:CAMPEP_0202380178 /NCGR_PEP_ID=MMETSP1127-20130417/27502_1 /ASSEMBLY_ACC=CAM_ASM_000462 /TAXON_ID=3047 /ORGANISM="Dunaliella tertiolecta, Strain CCMP1320" /LENGTH=600 /DNA_ID=CAMNT_0048978833 /DNA_START=71 /DNA_END=1873 /DNA_ORIENTATION=+
MGAQQSAAMGEAVNEVDQQQRMQQQAPENDCIKLYQYVAASGHTGEWKLLSSNARPQFYDTQEDSNTRKQDWFLEIENGDLDVRVDDSLSYVVDTDQRRLTFSAHDKIWALRFGNADRFKQFLEDFNDKMFYNMYGVENDEEARSKFLGEDYAGVFFATDAASRGHEPMEADEDFHDAEGTPEYQKERRAKEVAAQEGADAEAYNGLVMGANENTYIMRGKHFDVLRNVEGGVEDKNISFTLTPNKGTPMTTGRTTRSGAVSGTPAQGGSSYLTPSRVMLTNAESQMNLLTPDNPNYLYQADIETQKIVSTWNFNKDGVDIPMRDIHHDTKSACLEQRSTFLGLDNNRLCRWDTRTPQGIVQDTCKASYTGGKDFSRSTNFSCMATSGDGYVAVGSQDGKVRLYSNKSLQRANTSIPGLGAPITAIDITYDGKWVLATTDKYLMVVKTTFTTDKGEEGNAFTKPMGSRGSVPHLLRLRPEDMAHTGSGKFTKGKFTWITEAGLTERWIVANCGKHSVLWNFNRVKGSGTNSLSYGGLPTSMDYMLEKKDEEVVDAAFLHSKYCTSTTKTPSRFSHARDAGNALVVATPHHLTCLHGDDSD